MTTLSLLLAGGLHLLYFGVSLPYATWVNRHSWPHLDGSLTRVEFYRGQIPHLRRHAFLTLSTLALLWLFPGFSWDRTSQIFVLGREVLRPSDIWSGLLAFSWPSVTDLALGCAAYVVIIAIDLAYSRRCFDRDDPHMFSATPRTREERLGWIGLSVGAGVTEELTWRAVQPELIAQLTGHLWPAIVICTVTFGLGHIRQGRPFTFIAGLFALIFHALTLLTGSLYIAIVVHIAVNITVGLRAGTWRRVAGASSAAAL